MNDTYGYRTNLSMKNQENWLFANKLASRYFLILTHLILLFSIIIYLINLKGYITFYTSLFLAILGVPLIGFIIIIYNIEKKLKKK
ncbi:SdpI family protein [Aquimarina sp. I32.4]|uniref:SdpI family protein n=1 Tax=Aquimarina sp. I32.4 TaxID=2053903 RepID=UPI0021018DC3|nr:SdpI family protein [Aquimarina sp. I32.4]